MCYYSQGDRRRRNIHISSHFVLALLTKVTPTTTPIFFTTHMALASLFYFFLLLKKRSRIEVDPRAQHKYSLGEQYRHARRLTTDVFESVCKLVG